MGEDVKRSRMFRRNMDFKFVECGDMVHGNWSQANSSPARSSPGVIFPFHPPCQPRDANLLYGFSRICIE